MSNPNGNIASLTPWKKGTSGNPNGKSPGVKNGIRYHLNKLLESDCHEKIVEMLEEKCFILDDKTNANAIGQVLIIKALLGDMEATKLIAAQTELPLPKELMMNDQEESSVVESADELDRRLKEIDDE